MGYLLAKPLKMPFRRQKSKKHDFSKNLGSATFEKKHGSLVGETSENAIFAAKSRKDTIFLRKSPRYRDIEPTKFAYQAFQ